MGTARRLIVIALTGVAPGPQRQRDRGRRAVSIVIVWAKRPADRARAG